MNKIGNIILGFLMVIGAVLLREIVAAGGMIAYSVLQMLTGNITMDQLPDSILGITSNSDLILLISALGTFVWIVVFGLIYKSSRKKEGKKLFEGKISVSRILLFFVMGFGLQFCINSILGFIMLTAPKLMESYQQVVDSLGMGNSPISFLFIVLIAPIGEELVFRGAVFHFMKKHVSFWSANIFQAAFFGIYHMNIVQGLYAFVLGLLLGWVAERFGSIREPILLHMAVNFSGCVVGYLLPAFLFESLWGLAVLFAIAICLLVFSFIKIKINREPVN